MKFKLELTIFARNESEISRVCSFGAYRNHYQYCSMREEQNMRDPQSAQQRVVVALVGTGLMLMGKASGLFGSGAKLSIPVLALVVAVLLVIFVLPWVRQGQNMKLPSILTSKQATLSAIVVIGLAIAIYITVDAFWGKVPEYSFLLMGLGAMIVLFLLPLARSRKD